MKEMGGVREWFWKGEKSFAEAHIEAVIGRPPSAKQDITHRLTIRENGGRFEVIDEQIEYVTPYEGRDQPFKFYDFRRGRPFLKEFDTRNEELFDRNAIRPEQSILSQVRSPGRYAVLNELGQFYGSIFMFRNWQFGPNASLRRESSPAMANTFLTDGGDNLEAVLSKIFGEAKQRYLENLNDLFPGIEDFHVETANNGLMLFFDESGGRSIPKTRLSDGTLRYICLLAILLHPTPPPIIVIEEPEFGLHPDVIPKIAKLLVETSARTQLFVTTHSRLLIDALGDTPESVVICGRQNGRTYMERLDHEELREWLSDYSLGDLWSSGELGGNRL